MFGIEPITEKNKFGSECVQRESVRRKYSKENISIGQFVKVGIKYEKFIKREILRRANISNGTFLGGIMPGTIMSWGNYIFIEISQPWRKEILGWKSCHVESMISFSLSHRPLLDAVQVSHHEGVAGNHFTIVALCLEASQFIKAVQEEGVLLLTRHTLKEWVYGLDGVCKKRKVGKSCCSFSELVKKKKKRFSLLFIKYIILWNYSST